MKTKKLYRSQEDHVLGGVAGGIGEYLEIDPLIVRLVWLALIFSGVGVLLYIIAWVVIPNKPGLGKQAADEIRDKANAAAHEVRKAMGMKNKKEDYSIAYIFGALLIILGLGIFFQDIVGIDFWKNLWPIFLIVIGLVLIYKVKDNK